MFNYFLKYVLMKLGQSNDKYEFYIFNMFSQDIHCRYLFPPAITFQTAEII